MSILSAAVVIYHASLSVERLRVFQKAHYPLRYRCARLARPTDFCRFSQQKSLNGRPPQNRWTNTPFLPEKMRMLKDAGDQLRLEYNRLAM